MPLTRQQLIEAVKRHAEDHYNEDGWDFVVETMDDAEIDEHIGTARSVIGAIANVGYYVGLHDSVRKDIEGEAF